MNRKKIYSDSIDNAMAWLKKQQNEDGSLINKSSLLGYYTYPVVSNSTGSGLSAHRCIEYLRDNMFNDKKGLDLPSGVWDNMIPYPYGWTSYSAFKWEFFDFADQLLNFAMSYQDPYTGGLFGSNKHRSEMEGIIDFDSTSIIGISAIEQNKESITKKIANYLYNLYVSQPKKTKKFYWQWNTTNGLITEFDKEQSGSYVLDLNKINQIGYYKSGLLITFFSKYYLKTKDNKYLDVAKKHFDFVINNSEDVTELAYSHKFCWASSILYSITKENKHLDISKKIADHLVSLQTDEGYFHYKGIFEDVSDQPYDATIDVTAQFANWIANTMWRL